MHKYTLDPCCEIYYYTKYIIKIRERSISYIPTDSHLQSRLHTLSDLGTPKRRTTSALAWRRASQLCHGGTTWGCSPASRLAKSMGCACYTPCNFDQTCLEPLDAETTATFPPAPLFSKNSQAIPWEDESISIWNPWEAGECPPQKKTSTNKSWANHSTYHTWKELETWITIQKNTNPHTHTHTNDLHDTPWTPLALYPSIESTKNCTFWGSTYLEKSGNRFSMSSFTSARWKKVQVSSKFWNVSIYLSIYLDTICKNWLASVTCIALFWTLTETTFAE